VCDSLCGVDVSMDCDVSDVLIMMIGGFDNILIIIMGVSGVMVM
jgi:hypothetical protein